MQFVPPEGGIQIKLKILEMTHNTYLQSQIREFKFKNKVCNIFALRVQLNFLYSSRVKFSFFLQTELPIPKSKGYWIS